MTRQRWYNNNSINIYHFCNKITKQIYCCYLRCVILQLKLMYRCEGRLKTLACTKLMHIMINGDWNFSGPPGTERRTNVLDFKPYIDNRTPSFVVCKAHHQPNEIIIPFSAKIIWVQNYIFVDRMADDNSLIQNKRIYETEQQQNTTQLKAR